MPEGHGCCCQSLRQLLQVLMSPTLMPLGRDMRRGATALMDGWMEPMSCLLLGIRAHEILSAAAEER